MTVVPTDLQALQTGLKTSAMALVPTRCVHPTDRYEANLSRPSGAFSPMDVYRRVNGEFHLDLEMVPGHGEWKVMGRKPLHYEANEGTRALLHGVIGDKLAKPEGVRASETKSRMPCLRVDFTDKLLSTNPDPFKKMWKWANSMVALKLSGVLVHESGQVDVLGEAVDSLTCKGVLKAGQFPAYVPPGPEEHPLVKVHRMGAFHTVRSFASQAINKHWRGFHEHLKGEDHDEVHDFVLSLFQSVRSGTMHMHGVVAVDKPMLLRCDGADIILGREAGDSFEYDLHFDVKPEDDGQGVTLTFAAGSRITGKSVALEAEGSLWLDGGRSVRGKDIRLKVDRLHADVFLTNGEPDKMLLPVRVDAEGACPVAVVKGDFAVGGEAAAFAGEATFCLPAKVNDHNRTMDAKEGKLQLDELLLRALLSGQGKFLQPLPPPLNTSPYSAPTYKKVNLQVAVEQLEAHGRIDSHDPFTQRTGVRAAVPLHILRRDPRRRPLWLELDYEQRGNGPKAVVTQGMMAKFRVPVAVEEEGTSLAVRTPKLGIDVNHADLVAAGEFRRGTKVTDTNAAFQAKGCLEVHRLDGRLQGEKGDICTGWSLQEPASLRMCGSAQDVADEQAHLEIRMQQDVGAKWPRIEGKAKMNVPIDMDPGTKVDVTFDYGTLAISEASTTRFVSKGFSFKTNEGKPEVDVGHVGIECDARIRLEADVVFGKDKDGNRTWKPVIRGPARAALPAPAVATEEPEEIYYSAEEGESTGSQESLNCSEPG